jgi:hypothetical protein
VNQTNVQPLLFGYVRLHLLKTETELSDTKADLHRFAVREGFTLGTVFVEQAHTVPAGFEALIAAVKHYEARAVVVPSLHHLAVLGAPPALTEYVQSVTGVPVLVAEANPMSPRGS